MLIHDLRHSTVPNIIRSGVPEAVAMEIRGHKTSNVFVRYNITSEYDSRQAVQTTQAYVRSLAEK